MYHRAQNTAQSTIARTINLNGIGLHSGSSVSMELAPAQENTGIVFYLHVADKVLTLSPTPHAVFATELATTISMGDASLSTVEHVLSAINAMQIDNIQVHVYSSVTTSEMPILDGSAKLIYDALIKAGRKNLNAQRKYVSITKPFEYTDNQKSIIARPYKGLYIDYTIDFAHKSIGKQRFQIEVTPESYAEIANARTFGFIKEVEYLHSKGLALGGSLENAIVLDENGVMNPEGLRYTDEFVRHKTLDFIGDIAMLGLPLEGAFEVKCSGHQHNNVFLRKLLESQAFTLVTGEKVKKNVQANIQVMPSFVPHMTTQMSQKISCTAV